MDEAVPGPGKPITRRDLPAIVRRAAELAAIDDDVADQLPEDEVVRIAAELGITERHVRQALYEAPQDESEPSFLDRQLGTPRIIVSRAVPYDVERTQKAIENYLVTCEYLCVVRRQPTSTTFAPAPDTVSKVARAFKRNSKHLIASAQAVEVSIRRLDNGWSHVRVRSIFEDQRRGEIGGAVAGTVFLGIPAAALVTALSGGFATGILGGLGVVGQQIAVVIGAAFGIATFCAVAAGMFASMRKQFRAWREQAVTQVEGVLDRLESGEDMRPAPAPWVSNLKNKLGL